MSSSTLDLDGDEAPVTGLGHGTSALGPSDSSDSGSDIVGGPGMDEGLDDDQTREMPMTTRQGAGRDLGDPDLDSDSDRAGTGERGSSGIDSTANDQKLSIQGIASAADDFDDPDAVAGDTEPDADTSPDDRTARAAARIDATSDAMSDPDAAGDDDDLEDDADRNDPKHSDDSAVDDGAT